MIRTRIATIDDSERCLELLLQLFSMELEFKPDSEKQKRGLSSLLCGDIGNVFVIEVDMKIVGMVSLQYMISTALGGKVALLEDMVIDRDYRNKGYGTILFRYVIDYAKNNGCLRVTLLTDYNNNIAIKFYESFNLVKSPMIPLRIIF